MIATLRLLLIPALLTMTLAACERSGPAERAGRGLDRAGERVRDTVDQPLHRAVN